MSNYNNSPKKGKVDIQNLKNVKVGIIVSEWNPVITKALLKGSITALKKAGLAEANILVNYVPGSYELPLGAQLLEESSHPDGIICLGCVIQGETPHFDYICSAVSEGIMKLNFKYSKPFVFGVLTCNDYQQAMDRSGGIKGNKGEEAAYTALKMIELKQQLSSKKK
ncbi:MAG: 6,7-dimethyl-8-ribityllumazine synthase [Bacteroidota bacterium]